MVKLMTRLFAVSSLALGAVAFQPAAGAFVEGPAQSLLSAPAFADDNDDDDDDDDRRGRRHEERHERSDRSRGPQRDIERGTVPAAREIGAGEFRFDRDDDDDDDDFGYEVEFRVTEDEARALRRGRLIAIDNYGRVLDIDVDRKRSGFVVEAEVEDRDRRVKPGRIRSIEIVPAHR